MIFNILLYTKHLVLAFFTYLHTQESIDLLYTTNTGPTTGTSERKDTAGTGKGSIPSEEKPVSVVQHQNVLLETRHDTHTHHTKIPHKPDNKKGQTFRNDNNWYNSLGS